MKGSKKIPKGAIKKFLARFGFTLERMTVNGVRKWYVSDGNYYDTLDEIWRVYLAPKKHVTPKVKKEIVNENVPASV